MTDFIPGVSSTASALNAERIRLDIINQNIANANTTHGIDGKPYQRQQVLFETILQQQTAGPMDGLPTPIRLGRIQTDTNPGQAVYNPGNPDADSSGMVRMPNVSIQTEMADLLIASRAFEANLAVLHNAKTMAMATLQIGKG